MTEVQRALDDLLRQVRARLHEVENDPVSNRVVADYDKEQIWVAHYEGMAMAFHEVERLLEEVRAGLPEDG